MTPRYQPDLTPLSCCGHAAGCHECGMCQVVLNEGDYGASPIFCPCPENAEVEL
jgi:hypothetical protein